jgi:hypothetical protein
MKWQSSTRWFSQIWLHIIRESRKETRNFLYSWLPIGTYHNNMGILIYLFKKFDELVPFFP